MGSALRALYHPSVRALLRGVRWGCATLDSVSQENGGFVGRHKSDVGEDGDAGQEMPSDDEDGPPWTSHAAPPPAAAPAVDPVMRELTSLMTSAVTSLSGAVEKLDKKLDRQFEAITAPSETQGTFGAAKDTAVGMSEEDLQGAADKLMDRLNEHRRVVGEDRSTEPRPKSGSPEVASSSTAPAETGAGGAVAASLEEFRKGLQSPKEALLQHLDAYRQEVPW